MKKTVWFKKAWERLQPRDTDDIFIFNEQQGNRAVALTIVVTEAVYLVVLLFNLLGLFEGKALTVAATEGILCQLIPLTVYTAFGPGKPWMKNVLLGSLTLSLAIIDAQLTYKTALLMVIPIVISIRYFSKITTLRVAVFTAVIFALSAIWGAVHGILDVNIIDLPQNFTLFIGHRLVEALESMGLQRSMLIRDTLLLSYLPKLLLYVIVAYASVQSAARGHQMILEQRRISRVDAELSMAHDIQQSILPDPACAYKGSKRVRHLRNDGACTGDRRRLLRFLSGRRRPSLPGDRGCVRQGRSGCAVHDVLQEHDQIRSHAGLLAEGPA